MSQEEIDEVQKDLSQFHTLIDNNYSLSDRCLKSREYQFRFANLQLNLESLGKQLSDHCEPPRVDRYISNIEEEDHQNYILGSLTPETY